MNVLTSRSEQLYWVGVASWAAGCQTQEIELKFETFMLHVQRQKGDTNGREGCESGSLFIPLIHQLIKVFVLRRGMLDSRLFTVNYSISLFKLQFEVWWIGYLINQWQYLLWIYFSNIFLWEEYPTLFESADHLDHWDNWLEFCRECRSWIDPFNPASDVYFKSSYISPWINKNELSDLLVDNRSREKCIRWYACFELST